MYFCFPSRQQSKVSFVWSKAFPHLKGTTSRTTSWFCHPFLMRMMGIIPWKIRCVPFIVLSQAMLKSSKTVFVYIQLEYYVLLLLQVKPALLWELCGHNRLFWSTNKSKGLCSIRFSVKNNTKAACQVTLFSCCCIKSICKQWKVMQTTERYIF